MESRRAMKNGCSRKTVSLPADIVARVEQFLLSPGGRDLTFSAFVADSIRVTMDRIDALVGKKKR